MIKNKIYYYIEIKLKSPLSVGNGDEFLTDHDCIRNSKGEVFIPATSITGVFSHYLTNEQRQIFTPQKNNEYIQSPFFISDANLIKNENINLSIRDGVKLTENKTSEKSAKYNFEIIESGEKFEFRIEITVRDNDNVDDMKNLIDILLNGLNKGEILIGFKSKRGYGKVEVSEVKIREFSSKDRNELLEFNRYNKEEYDTYTIKNTANQNIYDYLEIDLKQVGGLSIRKYSATANKADFEHIKSNGIPVIPGTSWSGLIRKQIQKYIDEEIISDINLADWFGKEKTRDEEARASNIIFEESKILNSKEIQLTRNKIDRFSGGASDRALFTESAVFNGNTSLCIKIKKQITKNGDVIDNRKILGLLALVIKDLDNGLIALGGQTSIGRGIFKVENTKLNNEDINIDEYFANMSGGDLFE